MPLPAPKVRALVVEPDAEVAAALTGRLVDGLDADTHLAGTRADAEQLLTGGAYQLLVLADRLPDGEGVDLVRLGRAHAPDLAVVFLAGRGREAVALRALALGAAAHVPLDGDVAAETLFAARSALARRQVLTPTAALTQALVTETQVLTEDDGRALRAVARALEHPGVRGAAVFGPDGAPLYASLGGAIGAEDCGALAVRTQASAAALARLAALEPRGSLCVFDLGDLRLAVGRLDDAHLGAVLVAGNGPADAAAGFTALADAIGK